MRSASASGLYHNIPRPVLGFSLLSVLLASCDHVGRCRLTGRRRPDVEALRVGISDHLPVVVDRYPGLLGRRDRSRVGLVDQRVPRSQPLFDLLRHLPAPTHTNRTEQQQCIQHLSAPTCLYRVEQSQFDVSVCSDAAKEIGVCIIHSKR